VVVPVITLPMRATGWPSAEQCSQEEAASVRSTPPGLCSLSVEREGRLVTQGVGGGDRGMHSWKSRASDDQARRRVAWRGQGDEEPVSELPLCVGAQIEYTLR
jgi:hypothetical protein